MNINRLKKATKEISSISLGYFFTAIGGLLGVRILTAYLTPSQYGELALGITMGGFFYSVLIGPLTNGITRFFSIAKEKKEIRFYLFNVFKIILKSSTLISLLSLIVIILIFFSGNLEWLNLAILSIAFGLIYSLNNLILGLQIATRERLKVSLNQALITFSRFFIAVLFIKLFGASGKVAMFGQFIGLIIVFIIQINLLIPDLRRYISKEVTKTREVDWQKKIISFSRPLIIIGSLNWIRIAAEKWGIIFFTNYDEALGYYAIIYQFGYYPISLLINLLTNYLKPIYFERAGDNKERLLSTYILGIKIFISILIAFTFLIYFVFNYRDIIFDIILDDKYKSVSYLIGIMMMSSLLNESTSFVTLLMQTKRDTKTLLKPNALSYILGLLLTLTGAYLYGLYGVVLASLLNSSIRFIYFSLLCKNHYKKLIYYK